jgi:hypothetical protein
MSDWDQFCDHAECIFKGVENGLSASKTEREFGRLLWAIYELHSVFTALTHLERELNERVEKAQVYTVTLESESGDDYGPHSFDHLPTRDDLMELCGKFGSVGSGPGYGGSSIHISAWGFELPSDRRSSKESNGEINV